MLRRTSKKVKEAVDKMRLPAVVRLSRSFWGDVHNDLDGIPGLVPVLVPVIQGCKNPGSLGQGQTWDESKSLKFILIDSNFFLSPCPESLCQTRCFPVFSRDFSQR